MQGKTTEGRPMMCKPLRDEQGRVTAIICGGHARTQQCKFCHNQPVAKLCDFPVGPKKTCNAGMCARCATSVGNDLDYCPTHKHEERPGQINLFGNEPSCPACEAASRAAYNDGETMGLVHSRCEEH